MIAWRKNLIFIVSGVGLLAGLIAAYLFGVARKPQPPVFEPVSSPYASAIYANGIVESVQGGASNLNLFTEVPGTVTQVLAKEGQFVKAGAPLFRLDDTVQRATTAQLAEQAQAAQTALEELKAEPRPESLAIVQAELLQAQAARRAAQDAFNKREASYRIDPRSVSRDALDASRDALMQAEAAVELAERQLALTRAGAWSYDIRNQAHQAQALAQAHAAAKALLDKYVLKAPTDGVVIALNVTPGSAVSAQGAFDAYSQGQLPPVVMSGVQDELEVRCYVDEILVSRLPGPPRIRAQMTLRGTQVKVPLSFVRVQPYVSPKLELSNQRQERVDLRVLPVIFKFRRQDAPAVYPGQLVDVYIGQQ